MNTAQKLESIERNLGSVERKALDATPTETAWSARQIAAEIHRVTRSQPELSFVFRTLTTMAGQGLVKECPRGY